MLVRAAGSASLTWFAASALVVPTLLLIGVSARGSELDCVGTEGV